MKNTVDKTIVDILYSTFDRWSLASYRSMRRIGLDVAKWRVQLKNQN